MTATTPLESQLNQFRTDFKRLKDEIGKTIVGHDDVVTGTLTALVSGGHVLLEGVPGLGKTRLVRTLADSLAMKFQRVQFTPDLMPADLLGTNVVLESESGSKRFEFQQGPIFANVLLADEINRATPKTQSALLEAMQEGSVTIAGKTYDLPKPFFVMATQNPLEMEGTYPLPEAQLDRFFFKLLVKFPDARELESILDRTTETAAPTTDRIFDGKHILEMSRLARQIPIASDIRQFGIQLILGTHPNHPASPDITKRFVRYGSSPRGAQALILAAKIRAILDNRIHVAREDLIAVATPTLRHRIILNFEGQAENIQTDDIINAVIKSL
jgi:MoxR-like ATPase